MANNELKAPFPYFGGKGKVAGAIWDRFGDVQRYIEPFCGSAATLLARPAWHTGKTEIINDENGFIVNVYRAIAADAEQVWSYCDYPVTQLDMKARHAWLQTQRDRLRALLLSDPEACDYKIAGWWLWGAGAAWGSQWMRKSMTEMPSFSLPSGIHADNGGVALLRRLQARLRKVKIINGDWKRVVTDMLVTDESPTAVLLDPPYLTHDREVRVYESLNDEAPARDSYAWAVDAARRFPTLRIAYCSYRGHFDPPDGWSEFRWTTNGGYANTSADGRGRNNKEREVIWFSPGCLSGEVQMSLGL